MDVQRKHPFGDWHIYCVSFGERPTAATAQQTDEGVAMVSSIQSAGHIAAAYQAAALGSATPSAKAAASTQDSVNAGRIAPQDVIAISDVGNQIWANDALLPSPAKLQSLESSLTRNVNTLLAQAGISASPPFSFSVDPNTEQVTVSGDRRDAKAIENLINNDPALKQEFHRVSAEASQLSVFQKGLKAVDAYLAATTPTEVDAVIRQYYSGGPGTPRDIALSYDGASIQAKADGKAL